MELFDMYILVNENNTIVASSKNKPSEEVASAKRQRIYDVDDNEYDPTMIGQVLESFDIVERV